MLELKLLKSGHFCAGERRTSDFLENVCVLRGVNYFFGKNCAVELL